MKKRKFADGGDAALEDLAKGKSSGRFTVTDDRGTDSSVYQRALEFRRKAESGETEEKKDTTTARSVRKTPVPKAASSGSSSASSSPYADESRQKDVAPKAAPSPASAPAPSPAPAIQARAEIPVDTSLKAPAESDPEGRMAMSDTERNLRNAANALTPFGGAAAGRAAGSTTAKGMLRSWEHGTQLREVAKAAERGRASRAAIQARRAAKQKATQEALEEAKPILKARPKKPSPRSRTRDETPDVEFSKGGKVRGGGCEQRGKTRGRMY